MADVDWSRWRKCPVCYAGLGKPCLDLSGRNLTRMWFPTERAEPHERRRPRTGGTDG